MPTDPKAAYDAARALYVQGDIEAAQEALVALLDGGQCQAKDLLAALKMVTATSARTRRWGAAYRFAQRGVEAFPSEARFHLVLAEAAFQLGRDGALGHIDRALEIDPFLSEARSLRKAIELGPAKKTATKAIWPVRKASLSDPREAIKKHLLKGGFKRFIEPSTVFTTIGSCFAVNLARGLRAQGMTVHCESIGEEVNSTFANRYLLEWAAGSQEDRAQDVGEVFGPETRDRIVAGLRVSQALVLTLGVAPIHCNPTTGEFVFISPNTPSARDALARCAMRTSTVAENVANVHAIIDAAQAIAERELETIITVSPVPLAGTMEFTDAITADCLSKSTLRLAAHEIISSRSGVHYWPSFEMVRWMGGHFPDLPSPIYGGDDGNSRHVSQWVIDMIVSLFLEQLSTEARA